MPDSHDDSSSRTDNFLAFVRSVLDNCGAGWQPWLAPSSMDVLVRALNRALRIVTDQCRTTPVEALALEAGVPQYPTVARRLCGCVREGLTST